MVTKTRPGIHPAQYTETLLDPIVSLLRGRVPKRGRILDPCAGLGWRLAQIGARGDWDVTGVEIEPGYFTARKTHSCVVQGNSREVMWPEDYWDAWVTSVVYPNGMADDWQAKDSSVRNTYPHRLRAWLGTGYRLHPDNVGGYSPRRSPAAYAQFMTVQADIIARVFDALKPGAYGVVNTKDTPLYQFTDDTMEQLRAAGFIEVMKAVTVTARGNRHGSAKSRDVRAETEDLILCRKPPF